MMGMIRHRFITSEGVRARLLVRCDLISMGIGEAQRLVVELRGWERCARLGPGGIMIRLGLAGGLAGRGGRRCGARGCWWARWATWAAPCDHTWGVVKRAFCTQVYRIIIIVNVIYGCLHTVTVTPRNLRIRTYIGHSHRRHTTARSARVFATRLWIEQLCAQPHRRSVGYSSSASLKFGSFKCGLAASVFALTRDCRLAASPWPRHHLAASPGRVTTWPRPRPRHHLAASPGLPDDAS
jgi:hypothetical protein